jgi:hypothetical protein
VTAYSISLKNRLCLDVLGKLLALYLTGEFHRELLTERKTRLEENLASLRKEHQELQDMIENVTLSESQMEEIQKFCDGIRDRVDTASFEEKRQLLELLDVRGKLAVENDEKVVHVTCLIKLQPVSLALTSLWRRLGPYHPGGKNPAP